MIEYRHMNNTSQPSYSLAQFFGTPIGRYVLVGIIFSVIIFFFSSFMTGLAHQRNAISTSNYLQTTEIYNGELKQKAPTLNKLDSESSYLRQNAVAYSPEQLSNFAKNANIKKTNAHVVLKADFVKKGLEYQPTFKTQFEASYLLTNNSDQESIVSFEFPFPFSVANNEISNVKLLVNGVEVKEAKAKIRSITGSTADGLRWEGKLDPNEEITIQVSYDTVGIARMGYEGFENNVGAQDFYFNLKVLGTRSYDIGQGLSVDKRIFGDKSVELIWDKKNLFSTPVIDVMVANKLSPSTQVSRIYYTMLPIYALFMTILIWLGFKTQKVLKIKDMIILSILYILYFPLLHYLTSFTVDPTMEVFANFKNVGYFSFSLSTAFILAFLIIATIIAYLFSVMYGIKYALKFVLPTVFMGLGFFPMVVTIPEYSILLVLIGIISLVVIWIQVRLREE
jgi:hypothetical protein